MTFSRARSRTGWLMLGVALTACSNAGADLGFNLPSGGRVLASFIFDRDASGDATTPDTTFAGLHLSLVAAGSPDTVQTAITDTTGTVTFNNIPIGQYRLAVGPTGLGDSLSVTKVNPATVTVTVAGTTPTITAFVTYPLSTVSQARGLATGARVRVAGIVLSGAGQFADTTAHVRDATGAIRLLSVQSFDGIQNSIGDSVQVIGVVNSRNGQPVIDKAKLHSFVIGGPAPTADTVTASVARVANDGPLDADLIFLNTATIVGTQVLGSALVVTVDDGTAQMDLLLDPFLSPSASSFPVGGSVHSYGVLVPTGAGLWQLKPRASSDYTVF
jgi:hypothetical protein